MNNDFNNESSQFEILDILVLISFFIQMDDHSKSRKEYQYIHEHLESIESKLDKLLERKDYENKRNDK